MQKGLAEAQEAYKTQADKRRIEPKPFNMGDRVYLSTCYLQSLQTSKKLGARFVGSFLIKRIINLVTVELDLPNTLHRVHPVFHCSLLKPEVSLRLTPAPSPVPEPFKMEGEQHFEVIEILDSHKHSSIFG